MLQQCRRCDGKGTVVYRLGKPGQDRRVLPYADIEWLPPVTKKCPVCRGMKKYQVPEYKPRPQRAQIYWNEPLTDEEREELTNQEEPPDHVYDREQ